MTENILTATNFHESLREQTSASHQKLESLPVSSAIISPTVTIGEYALYLSLMADVIHDVESNLFPMLESIIPDLQERHKRDKILSDIAVLGKCKSAFQKVFETEALTIPFALGIFYVVEGSVLGGRFILKNIHSALGFDATSGATYFAGYGNQTGSAWKSFMETMIGYEATTESRDAIIAGADYAFKAIYTHLQKQAAWT